MSNEYKGYQDVLDHFDLIKKQLPKGISLKVNKNKLYFQFKTKNKKRSQYSVNENFTIVGLNRCLEKAIKLSDKLSNYQSENELFDWYDQHIKGINKQAVNDAITFEEAIAKLEHWFFNRKDRRGLKRTKEADWKSFHRTYNIYLQKLPSDKQIIYTIFLESLNNYCDDKEQRKYQDCLNAYLKLCEINELNSIYNKLEKLKRLKTKVSRETDNSEKV